MGEIDSNQLPIFLANVRTSFLKWSNFQACEPVLINVIRFPLFYTWNIIESYNP